MGKKEDIKGTENTFLLFLRVSNSILFYTTPTFSVGVSFVLTMHKIKCQEKWCIYIYIYILDNQHGNTIFYCL